MTEIAVFSQELDIHALAIISALNKRDRVQAHLISADALVTHGGLRWCSDSKIASLKTHDGNWIDLAHQDLIWWRRVNQPQKALDALEEGELKDFIMNGDPRYWESSTMLSVEFG